MADPYVAPLITVDGFHKSYKKTLAVEGLSFELPARAILGLIGPNGAGKTTTLRVLAGIMAPTLGHLSIDGHDIVSDPVAAKRMLAYVPDDPKLFDALTVWEHFLFTASAYQVADWEAKAGRLLQQLELEPKRESLAQELSRGMRQKVAIGCAYLRDPKVILLDEPLTGLDPRGIRAMKESVAWRAQSGAAVILSSHLLSLVEDLCTHLLILHQGRNLFFGTLAAARARFAELRTDASLEEVFFLATEAKNIGAPPQEPVSSGS